MIDLGDFKTRSISGVSDELMERFDIVAKRIAGTRSAFIRMFMMAAVENARYQWEREAKTSQFVQHAVNDTLKMCGLKPTPLEKDPKEVRIILKGEAN